jgi:rsbT antagonist protein RsbS
MQVSRDVVVASIQVDLDDDVLARLREDLLGRLHEADARAVILDVSGLETLDSGEFAELRKIIKMVTIMGGDSVLVGLQPGVVSALIEMEADVEGLQTAIDLDAAFALLEPEPISEQQETDPDVVAEVAVESDLEADASAESGYLRAESLLLESERDFEGER